MFVLLRKRSMRPGGNRAETGPLLGVTPREVYALTFRFDADPGSGVAVGSASFLHYVVILLEDFHDLLLD